MREFLAITKALSDETRVRASLAVCEGELCLCQLVEFLDLSPATVSRHMDVLAQARLVERRKEGRWCFFRAAGSEAPAEVQQILEWASSLVGQSSVIQNDMAKLIHLRKTSLRELSACYKG